MASWQRFAFLALFTVLFCPFRGMAQVPNDDCLTAISLPVVNDYCSEPSQFSNRFSQPSVDARPACWPDGSVTNDVWFVFVPDQTGVVVQVYGATDINDETLQTPSVAVYEGPCRDLEEVACGSISDENNVVERIITDLTLGQVYYIRVDARNDFTGTFQICVDFFTPVKPPEGDCGDAVVLCDKTSFVVPSIVGTGEDDDVLSNTCIREELASVWYSWVCKESGTLTFSMRPTNPNSDTEDLDFVLFELEDGLDNCDSRRLLRCMASGETIGAPDAQNEPCRGATGLREGETDFNEQPGCRIGDNNFVAPIDMIAGRAYSLIVNNYSRTGFGFDIRFGGTGTFAGPEPDFEIEAIDEFECDKRVIFDNRSTSVSDEIVSWTWNFGAGATPTRMDGPGPHEVLYESFGNKKIALTVESARGCVTTKILDQFINACCQDTSTLDVQATPTDLVCPGIPSGVILANGINGSPDYMYSLDGINFQTSPVFTELDVGRYTVFIQDEKGCTDDITMVDIDEPDRVIVDAGEDVIIELGDDVDLNADVSPLSPFSILTWSPPDSLSCVDCLDPNTDITSSTDYLLTVVNGSGCVESDTVTVRVIADRSYYAPNILKEGSFLDNDRFSIFLGKGGRSVNRLQIFDRWGNVVYAANSPILKGNEESQGWDGTFRDRPVEPGVYFWSAEIWFLDGDPNTGRGIIEDTGTITVIR